MSLNLRQQIQSSNVQALISALSSSLSIKVNDLVGLKLSAGNQRLPDKPQQALRMRAASIVCKAVENPISVRILSKAYNRKKNRGSRPDRLYPAATSIIRRLVQRLEAAGYLQSHKKGRYTTDRGKSLIATLLNATK